MIYSLTRCLVLVGALILVGACGSSGEKVDSGASGQSVNPSPNAGLRDPNKGLLSEWFDRGAGDRATGIGVNAYLWRASLDTISFLPISQADPYGGTIFTDWHQLAETPDERYKINVYILDSALRSDGIRVSVFRQKRTGGDWNDIEVSRKTARSLENAILTRARQLRVGSIR